MAQPYSRVFPECWFSRLLARKGEDYITAGKIQDIEVIRNVDRIINDIIDGKIDYSKYGNCILAPTVFDNLLSYCRNKASTTTAQLFALSYTNWACETGNIIVANTNYFPGSQEIPQGPVYPPYDYDVSLWNTGSSTITQSMRNTISTALRDISIENQKYSYLRDIFEKIQVSRNIYELQWATTGLKQFVRSTSKYTY